MPVPSGIRPCAGEPGGIEAVEAAPARVGIGQLLRQGAQVAFGGDEFGVAAHLLRRNRLAGDARVARQQRRDLVFAFLRLQRADAIDQGTRRA